MTDYQVILLENEDHDFEEVVLNCNEEEYILDVAEEKAGVRRPYSCRAEHVLHVLEK